MWCCRDLFDVPLVCVCVYELVHAPSCTHSCPRAVAFLFLWCVIYHLIDWALCIRAALFKRSSHGRGVSSRYCFNKTVSTQEGTRSWLVTKAGVQRWDSVPLHFSFVCVKRECRDWQCHEISEAGVELSAYLTCRNCVGRASFALKVHELFSVLLKKNIYIYFIGWFHQRVNTVCQWCFQNIALFVWESWPAQHGNRESTNGVSLGLG